MELYMYFNEELVDSLCLDATRISQPGYIGQKKRYLLNLHKLAVEGQAEPQFYVHGSNQSLPSYFA